MSFDADAEGLVARSLDADGTVVGEVSVGRTDAERPDLAVVTDESQVVPGATRTVALVRAMDSAGVDFGADITYAGPQGSVVRQAVANAWVEERMAANRAEPTDVRDRVDGELARGGPGTEGRDDPPGTGTHLR